MKINPFSPLPEAEAPPKSVNFHAKSSPIHSTGRFVAYLEGEVGAGRADD